MDGANESNSSPVNRSKFFIGGFLIVAAIIYLIVSSTKANAQYFLTVDEVYEKGSEILGRELRVSGAVIGDTIEYNPQTLTLKFTVAHIPADNESLEEYGGLATALHQAVIDPDRSRLQVVYEGPKPDLLQNEAQAIMTGHMGEDSIFYADELLLKCPTKYEEAVPQQVEN